MPKRAYYALIAALIICIGAPSVACSSPLKAQNGSELSAPSSKVSVAICGDTAALAALLADDSRYFVREINSSDLQDLSRFRVLILHNIRIPAGPQSPLVHSLAAFVERGGNLLLAGDTCRFVSSPFPRVVSGCLCPSQTRGAFHLPDTLMKVTDGRWIIEEFTGHLFETSSPRHIPLKMGPEGATIILDRYDWPIVIGGRAGSGKVLFSGCDYSRLLISGEEADIVHTLIDYLAGFAGGPRKL